LTLQTRLDAIVTRIGAEIKGVRTLVNGNAANLNSLSTTNKTDLVAAINEVNAKPTGNASINDATTATTSVWSSSKTNNQITSAVASVVASSPTALDTLNELATALGNDANFATTINASLGNRVRVDAAQTLTAPQQAQGRSNIGAQDTATIGDPDVDLVSIFNAALI
jgi:hypothetical protein